MINFKIEERWGDLTWGEWATRFLVCFFHFLFCLIFGLLGFLGCLVLSGVLRFLASLLIEIASSRGAGVHACDRHRLSFLF